MSRDPYATYNNLTLAQLYKLTPSIGQGAWAAYFSTAGLAIDGRLPSGIIACLHSH
jgi:hypothetical protein